MNLFSLPHTAKVQKVVPKNAFDGHTNTWQKKLFTDLIARITWIYKLSPETINLQGEEISEIQVFLIELKVKKNVSAILDIIDKAIPYHIVFIVQYEENVFLSTSAKHPHPLNEDNAVIDWTFRSDWFSPVANQFSLHLRKNLDFVYGDLCHQLSTGWDKSGMPLSELIAHCRELDTLEKQITKLKAGIARCSQFKLKVEMNLELKRLEQEFENLNSSPNQ